jgi:hypothetical protein
MDDTHFAAILNSPQGGPSLQPQPAEVISIEEEIFLAGKKINKKREINVNYFFYIYFQLLKGEVLQDSLKRHPRL